MRVKHAVVLLMLISPLSWAGTMTFQFRNPNFGGGNDSNLLIV
ncbi:curli assembly protein CsgF, partial [Escherichia coli]